MGNSHAYLLLFFASAALILIGSAAAHSTNAFSNINIATYQQPNLSICSLTVSEIKNLTNDQVNSYLAPVGINSSDLQCADRFIGNFTNNQINGINQTVLTNILDNYTSYSTDTISNYTSTIVANTSSITNSTLSALNITLPTSSLILALRRHINLNATTISELLAQQAGVTNIDGVPTAAIINMVATHKYLNTSEMASIILSNISSSTIYGIPKSSLVKLFENSTSLNTSDLISLIESNARRTTIGGYSIPYLIQILQSYSTAKGPIEMSILEYMPTNISVDGVSLPTKPLLHLIENGSSLNTSDMENLILANLPPVNVEGIPLPVLVQLMSGSRDLRTSALEYMLESAEPRVMGIPTYTLIQLLSHNINLKTAAIQTLFETNLPQTILGFPTDEILWDIENNNMPSTSTIENRLLSTVFPNTLKNLPPSLLIGILNQSIPLNTSTVVEIINDINPSLLEFLPQPIVTELITNPRLINNKQIIEVLFQYIDPNTVYNIPAPVLMELLTHPAEINDQTFINYVLPSIAPSTIAGIPTSYIIYILQNTYVMSDPYTIENLLSYVAPSVVSDIPPDVMYTLLTNPDKLNTTSLSNILLYIAPTTVYGIPTPLIKDLITSLINGHPPLKDIYPLSINNLLYLMPSSALGGLSPTQIEDLYTLLNHFTFSVPTLQRILYDLPQSGLTSQMQAAIAFATMFTSHNRPVIMSISSGQGGAPAFMGRFGQETFHVLNQVETYMSLVQGVMSLFSSKGFTTYLISQSSPQYINLGMTIYTTPEAAYGMGSLQDLPFIQKAINSSLIPRNSSPVAYILKNKTTLSSYIAEITPGNYNPINGTAGALKTNSTSGSLSWAAVNYTYMTGINATYAMGTSIINATLFNLTEGGRLAHKYAISHFSDKIVNIENENTMAINSQMGENFSIVAYVPKNLTLYWNGSDVLINIPGRLNSTLEVNLSRTGMPLIGMGINLKEGINSSLDLFDASIGVASHSEGASNTTYAYININSSVNDSYIKNTTYLFDVRKGWLAAHGVSPSNISLYKMNESTDVWSAVNTVFLGGNNTSYQYEAVSDSLSYYAIGASAPAQNNTQTITSTTIPATTTPTTSNLPPPVTKQRNQSAVYIAAAIAILLIIAIAYYLKGSMKKKKHRSPINPTQHLKKP